jgi:hypothetical protein
VVYVIVSGHVGLCSEIDFKNCKKRDEADPKRKGAVERREESTPSGVEYDYSVSILKVNVLEHKHGEWNLRKTIDGGYLSQRNQEHIEKSISRHPSGFIE